MVVSFNTKSKIYEKENSMSSPNDCLYRMLNDGHVKGRISSLNEEDIKISLHFTNVITFTTTIPKELLPRKYTGAPFDYFFGDMYPDKSTICFEMYDDDCVTGEIKFVHVNGEPEDRVMIVYCGCYPNHLDGFTMGIDEIQRCCEDCNKDSCVEKNKKGE